MVFGLKIGLPKKAPAEPPRNDAPASAKEKEKSGEKKSALTVNEFVARTKRSREKGLEPTKPELIAYARYLGVDPILDNDLMWIADEALSAPLPAEWTEHHDSADRVFYYNVQTHASAWTHPLEQLHRDTYKSIVGFRSGDMSKEDQAVELEKMRAKCERSESDAHQELQAWTEHVDEQGQKFFYNREQQRSVWTDPRPARCHALYLEMKALRVLSKHCGQPVSSSRGPEPLSPSKLRVGADRGELIGATLRSRHQQPLDLCAEGASASEQDDGKENRKRKKKDRKDRDRTEEQGGGGGGSRPLGGGHLQALHPAAPHDSEAAHGDLRASALDLKKPSLSAVQEVRQALGVTPALTPLHRGMSLDNNLRLPSEIGDGLSTVGRTKVRAGIRLEPLLS